MGCTGCGALQGTVLTACTGCMAFECGPYRLGFDCGPCGESQACFDWGPSQLGAIGGGWQCQRAET